MNREDIIRMAREANEYADAKWGLWPTGNRWKEVRDERLVELVRADEREACAKVVGDFAKKWWSIHCDTNKHMETTRKAHDDFCALQAAIRARGNT